MPERLDGLALALIGAGGLITYAGIKGLSIPSAIQALVQGQSPAGAQTANQINATVVSSSLAAASSSSGSGGLINGTPGGGSSGGTPSQNQALAQLMAGGPHPDWITGQKWSDWIALWNAESGWSQFADTRKSGLDPANATVFAYGIPQARPYSKMPQAAWPADKGGKSDPATQIAWGIQYIEGRYGDPSAAEAHEKANGWY